jgi:hypothetical protein
VWVGRLFYTGFQGDLRSFYILSIQQRGSVGHLRRPPTLLNPH